MYSHEGEGQAHHRNLEKRFQNTSHRYIEANRDSGYDNPFQIEKNP